MKESKAESKSAVSEPKSAKAALWVKTPFANLIRYVPSGTFFARIRTKGKLLRRSLKTDVLSVAKMRLSDLERIERQAAEAGTNVQQGKVTFGDALGAFLRRVQGKPNLKPRTKAYYQERADALLKSWPGLDRLDIRQISKAQCLDWAAGFGAKSCPTAFNHTVSVLKRTFAVAIEFGGRYDNPAGTIEWIKERPKKLQLPEPDQFDALVREIENCGWVYAKDSADMVRFLAYGGFRRGEAINVTWGDCDLVKGKITVRGDPITGTKNSEARDVPMIPDMRRLLEDIRAARRDDPLEAPVIRFKDARKALAHACEKLGIPKLTHHDLRHLFATRCIESGVDIPTVSRWLGHRDGGALAMRVYGHLRDQHSTEMAKRVTFSQTPAENIIHLPAEKAV